MSYLILFRPLEHRVFNYDGQIRNAQAQPDVQAPDGHLRSGT